MEFEGVHTPIITPFDGADAIDLGALERLIEFQLDAGVAGLIPAGSTGEFYALTEHERLNLLRFVAERAKGRCVLTAGANAATTSEVIRFARAAGEYGYDAIMLAPPYYSLPAQDELLAHFRAVLKSVDIPIVLYNFPARAGVEIGYQVLDGLAEEKNIVAIKESSGDINRLYAIRQRYQGRIQLVCGGDDQAFDYVAWGTKAWICGAANVAPAQHVSLWNDGCRGDFEASRRTMERVMPLVQSMEGGKYIQKAKYGVELAGLPAGHARAPLLPLSRQEKAEFAAVFEIATANCT